jgi:6-phosphogluconolactonase/glucosamine-6-phosphate isomerase/deaminase
MKLHVHDTSDAMAKAAAETAARILRDAIAKKGQAAFIAATGVSQFGFLKYLVAAPTSRGNGRPCSTWTSTSGFRPTIRPASDAICVSG